MATTVREPLPPVTRVGYDHGWHLLGPTFLNLGVPMLVVDKAFIDPRAYGLETFGTRDPRMPLPRTPLLVEHSGRFVGSATSAFRAPTRSRSGPSPASACWTRLSTPNASCWVSATPRRWS